ncbi:hypothetical protein B0A52_00667 [Exophiala mesophila]|uniref:SPIN90/Ldb17 leucine-rich domain-containing protein n=1 Tax=Exophiala mesophila TaxID=212818 RepID=A0A438NHV8_EXOME|nr:hypothetical protein B0A52_00667 [Exophiala mesophila]
MEPEPTHDFEHEDQFWGALDKALSQECHTHSDIDDVLRSYLNLIHECRDQFLQTDNDLGRCALWLQDSSLFSTHADYIRRQFVQCLLEDDEPHVILIATTFLIADARSHDRTYELLNEQGAFCRLVDLILSPRRYGQEDIHRLLMELLYEMSRIQKIKPSDLAHISDDFIKMLFEIIEQVSDDVNDPYHYPTIRVLLVLNEQFMVAAHGPSSDQTGVPLTNKVIKLQHPPHYKRDELRKLLIVLSGGHLNGTVPDQEGAHSWGHFDAVDETTKRLVKRCQGVTWLFEPEGEQIEQTESPTSENASNPVSPTSPTKSIPPALPAPRKLRKRNSSKGSTLTIGHYLTPQLEGARHSSLSMMEVAAQKEKPGVITPSRNPALKQNLRAAIMHEKKERPPLPQARRSGWSRTRAESQMGNHPPPPAENAGPEGSIEAVQVDGSNKVEALPQDELPTIVREREEDPVRSPEDPVNKVDNKGSAPPELPAPRGSHHHHHIRPHFKKPPPTPKARRWRGKGKGEDEGPGAREPGRFNPSLPSIVTTTTSGQKIPAHSPFSPLRRVQENSESLSPEEHHSTSSVAEALSQAQARAVEDVTEAMDQVKLGEEQVPSEGQLPDELNQKAKNNEPSHDSASLKGSLHKTESIVEEDEAPQQFHDAVHTQPERQPSPIPPPLPLTRPPTSRSLSASKMLSQRAGAETSTKPQVEPAALPSKPRVILTPPGQEPSRGVPGPQYALERSPFLTDDEIEAEVENDS